MTRFEIGLKNITQKLRKTIELDLLREVIKRLGNELILDNLLRIIRGGYDMNLGWTPKEDITFKIYKTLLESGQLEMHEGITQKDWYTGAVKTGTFYMSVKQMKSQDNIKVGNNQIAFEIDFSQLERDLLYLQNLRMSGRDYLESLNKIINEELSKQSLKDKMKEIIESINKLYIE